jgi:hypothetical protein
MKGCLWSLFGSFEDLVLVDEVLFEVTLLYFSFAYWACGDTTLGGRIGRAVSEHSSRESEGGDIVYFLTGMAVHRLRFLCVHT